MFSQAALILNSIGPEGIRKEPRDTGAGKRAVFQLSYLCGSLDNKLMPLQNTVLLTRSGEPGA